MLCLHGYGADAADLAPLAAELELPGPARWLFPEGPLKAGPFSAGRAWFPVDEREIQRVQMRGEPWDLSSRKPEGLEEAVAAVRGCVEALGIGWERLILGGFSQGSMMALELFLGAPKPPLGLFLLSGNLVDEGSVRARAPSRAGARFFQSHGREDPVLSYPGALRLYELLRACGLEGELFTFHGGHALPVESLRALGGYLGSLLSLTHS